ncbi:MAG: glycoside hydrolase family protein [Clostridia bacterium]|nr:glycoside hydrolase family protein [Clostridia bacterium]
MKKTLSNILTVMLAMLMALYVFPYEVIAMTTDTSENTDTSDVEIIEEAPDEEAYVLHEVDELRETEVKHYRLSNGSYAAVEFPNAVHYETEEEEYIDIDNTLTLGENGYNNTDNAVEYTFSDDFDSDTILDCTYGEYGISFSFVKEDTPMFMENITSTLNEALNLPGRQYIEISNPGAEPESTETENGDVVLYSIDNTENTDGTESIEEEKLSVEEWIQKENKSSSSIKYVNYSDGIDLRYDLIGDILKEYIILKNVPDTNEFAFGMSFTGLTPTLNEDKSITLANAEGESIFTIPAPYMADEAGNVSYDCEYGLAETEEGYILTVTVSEEWLNAEDRVYPVMIDPPLFTSQQNTTTNNAITTAYHSQVNGPTPAGYGDIFMGYDSSADGRYTTFMKVNDRPVLPNNCILLKATMDLFQRGFSLDRLTEIKVSAREVTSATAWYNNYSSVALDYCLLSNNTKDKYISWDVTEAAKKWYNNEPNNGIAFVSETDYTNGGSKAIFVGFNNSGQYVNAQPVFTVYYNHTIGIEDRYSYLTQSVGTTGTGYVRVYDGALTAERADTYFDSDVMSFGISHIYNSAYSNINFTGDYIVNGETEHSSLNTLDYTQMFVGRGWKLNLQQTITEKEITIADNTRKTYKIYTDADGTEHYFYLDEDAELDDSDPTNTKVYIDEDGLGLTIKETETSLILTNDQDDVYRFCNGYLYKIEDANGNRIQIHYGNASSNSLGSDDTPAQDRNRILKVTQTLVGGTSKTIATLTYNGSKLLSTITDHAGRVTTYSYNSTGYLTSVTEVTDAISYYYYASSTPYRMTRIYNSEIKYGIDYTYSGNGVSSFTEFAKNGTSEPKGAQYWLNTSLDGVSYVRDTGSDRITNTNDDIVTTYLFDDFYRTVNSYSANQKMNSAADDSFRIYGTSAAMYTPTTTVNVRDNNHIIRQAMTGGVAENKLYDPGAESDYSAWSSAVKTTEQKRNGNYSFKLSGGDNFYQTRQLSAGTYTFSAYIKVTTAASDTQVYLSFGNQKSRVLKEKTSDGIWERLSLTFTTYMRGSYMLKLTSAGTSTVAYADDLQLEVGEGASRVNLLDNGNFENNGKVWTPCVTGVSEFYTDTSMPGGSYALKLSGSLERNVMKTEIPLAGVKAGETFIFSGWAKANSVPLNDAYVDKEHATEEENETDDENDEEKKVEYKPESKFKLYAEVEFTDSSKDHQWFQNSFNPEIIDQWQYLSIMIVPQHDVKSITVGVCYSNNNGYAYFDNLSLIREEVATYKYKDGKLTCVTSSSSEEAADYDYAAGNLIEATLPGAGTYNYTYQTTGNTHLATSVTCDTLKTSFTYNGAGLNTESILSSTTNTSGKKIRSTAEYTTDNRHVKKTTDTNGFSSATATYNAKNEMSKSTATPSNTSGSTGTVSTVYTYDSAGRAATSYISGVISLANKYEGGRIKWINRGGYVGSDTTKQEQAYAFEYDIWGNTTSTNVGYIDNKGTTATTDDVFVGNELATYTYEEDNGNLESMKYENGAVVEYTYDMFDRIKTETHKDYDEDNELSVLYTNTYYYNGDGSLARVEKAVDKGTEIVIYYIYYNYDGIGRVLEVSEYEGDTLINRQSYGYDNINRTNKATVQAGTNKVESTYTYDDTDGKVTHLDNSYTASNISGIHGFDYTYDYLKRLTAKELTTSVGSDLTATYGYADNQSNSTYASTLINSLYYTASSATGNIFTFDYTYDNIGNIKKSVSGGIRSHTTGTNKYYYDKQNQLVMEQNTVADETYLYEYDTYGNIRYKHILDSTGYSDIDSAMRSVGLDSHVTFTYTYGNSEWKDQLTAYNGANFTYDDIGNPLIYFNGDSYNFTWENGRQLVRAEVNDEPVTFTYDTDGLRTSKTLSNGNFYDFYYVGDILVCQTWYEGQRQLNFLYDESGNVYGFVYNDGLYTAPYYYVKNLQGDVIAILNGSNAVVAEYAYDAWGNILSVTDGNGNAVSLSADHIANINPIRYRSYDYDTETMFYYLQSRYYDPYLGRFINTDGYMSTGQGFEGYNMYAYCGNNPVNRVDIMGTRYCAAASVSEETKDDRKASCNWQQKVSLEKYNVEPETSPEGVNFIAGYESYESEPYNDGYGNWTIGYGHVVQDGEMFEYITKSDALTLLATDLKKAERLVIEYSEQLEIKWDQNEFDALVSLAYNSGGCVYYVMDALVQGTDPYDAFRMIVYAGETYSKGLYNRRSDEAEIFMYGDYRRNY